MCGIAGLFKAAESTDASKSVLSNMLSSIRHRGPDDEGIWHDGGMYLGHRRLSVIDLSPAGHQPMASNGGRFHIVFNGEIYNHHVIKRELASERAIHWRGHSDTEVLVNALEFWGVEKTLARLNGMFAFAAWDTLEGNLTLARDHFGEKPLYYALPTSDTIAFASELVALERCPAVDRTLDEQSICEYLMYRYFPAPRTVYKNVRKLEPGHYLSWSPEKGILQHRPFWSLRDKAIDGISNPLSSRFEDCVDELDGLLHNSVRLRMESDVPLGAFLSGGIDSSIVTAVMQANSNQPIKTFSIGFDIDGFNEAPFAKQVAQHLGTDHTEHYFTGTQASGIAINMGQLYDEPFADSSQLPTYLVSSIARESVTVALSGDGGDEIFAGYGRYQQVPAVWNKLQRLPLRSLVCALLNALPERLLSNLLMRAAPILNKGLNRPLTRARLDNYLAQLGAKDLYSLYRISLMSWKSPASGLMQARCAPDAEIAPSPEVLSDLGKMTYHDSLTYLPGDILTKVDRAAMAVSLETRIPLLDPSIAAFSWRLPDAYKSDGGNGKRILKELLYRYVPQEIIDRPKMGFGVPLGEWLRTDLSDWCQDLLSPANLGRDDLFDSKNVASLLDKHNAGEADYSDRIWPLLMFQSWREHRR